MADSCSARPSYIRTGTGGFDERGRPRHLPGTNSSPQGSVARLSNARGRDEFPGAFIQPAHWLVLSGISGRRPGLHQHHATDHTRAAVPWARPGRGPTAGARAESAGTQCRNTSARSRNRQCDVVLQALPGIDYKRRAGNRQATCYSSQSATATSSRSRRRAANISGTIKPAVIIRPRRSATRSTANSTSRSPPETWCSVSHWRSKRDSHDTRIDNQRITGHRDDHLPAEAQQYEARRNGDIVQLEDKKNQTVVSIITSVGNMALRDESEGAEHPAISVCVDRRFQGEADRPARDSFHGPVGQPSRRAGVLRQRQAVPLRHAARQRHRRDSDSRIHEPHRSVAGGRGQAGRQSGVGDEPAGNGQAAVMDEAVALRTHDRHDLPAAGWDARSA